MSIADSAEYQLEQLAGVLNGLREDNIQTANSNPGNDAARQSKWEAIGALRILHEVAEQMGLKAKTTYSYL